MSIEDDLPIPRRVFIRYTSQGRGPKGGQKHIIGGALINPANRPVIPEENRNCGEIWEGDVILIPRAKVVVPYDFSRGLRIDQVLTSYWFTEPRRLLEHGE
jgi:hypothetical protein